MASKEAKRASQGAERSSEQELPRKMGGPHEELYEKDRRRTSEVGFHLCLKSQKFQSWYRASNVSELLQIHDILKTLSSMQRL